MKKSNLATPEAQEYSESHLKRLYNWLKDDNREPANTKFTSGWLRNVAKEIEYRIKGKVDMERLKISWGVNQEEGKEYVALEDLGYDLKEWNEMSFEEQNHVVQKYLDDADPAYAMAIDFELQD